MTSLPQAAAAPTPSPYIKDVGVQNFMAEVVQASLQVPVLVYFTAAWCQPCKQYGPLLEKVVTAAKGKVKLARVDIDKSPQLAQQFRIQSVPMVYIFLQGQPLEGFAGALPESQLKQLIDQVAGAGPEGEALQATIQMADQLYAQGDIAGAKETYGMLLAGEEQPPEAIAGLVKCLVAEGELEEAESLLATVPAEKQGGEVLTAARAMLTLARSAPQDANIAALEKAVEGKPDDHQARFDLSVALFAAGRQEEAVEALLAIIAQARDWKEGAARTQLLAFFEALGFASPVAAQGRRKLSSLLFA